VTRGDGSPLPEDTGVFVLQLNNTGPLHTQASRAALAYYIELMEEACPDFARRLQAVLDRVAGQSALNRCYQISRTRHGIPEEVHELLKLHSGCTSSNDWPAEMLHDALGLLEAGVQPEDEEAAACFRYTLSSASQGIDEHTSWEYLKQYATDRRGPFSPWFYYLCWLNIEQERLHRPLVRLARERNTTTRALWQEFCRETPRLARTVRSFSAFADNRREGKRN
jgi:hypothetical protein